MFVGQVGEGGGQGEGHLKEESDSSMADLSPTQDRLCDGHALLTSLGRA